MKPNDRQPGGNHYKSKGPIQPWDVIHAWRLNFLEGCMLKRICRWRVKGGVEDLRKILHECDKYAEQNPGWSRRRVHLRRTFQQLVFPALFRAQSAGEALLTHPSPTWYMEMRVVEALSPERGRFWLETVRGMVEMILARETEDAGKN